MPYLLVALAVFMAIAGLAADSQAANPTPIPELAAWQANMLTFGASNCADSISPQKLIASSTNATPIEITTTTAHGLSTGAAVSVHLHQTNTAANSSCGAGEGCRGWVVTVVDTTRFTLNGSTGNGVGGTTGYVITNDGLALDGGYYDGVKVYLNIAAYTGDTATWYPCVDNNLVERRDWYYAINNGAVTGFEHFEEGLATDYLVRGNTASRTMAVLLSQNAAFAADGTPLAFTVTTNRMREVAYALISYVQAETLGQAKRVPRYDDVLNQIVGPGGHVAQTADGTSLIARDDVTSYTNGASAAGSTTFTSATANFSASHVGAAIFLTSGTGCTAAFYTIAAVVNPSTVTLASSPCATTASGIRFDLPYVYGYKPFMVGIMLHALIDAYEWRVDARIPPAVKQMLDYIWTNAWFPDECGAGVGAFRYLKTYNGLLDILPGSCPADLNMLIAPAFAWYYKQSGDTTYRDRGNTVFQEGVQGAFLGNGKQFNQNYWWSFKYLDWYNAAAASGPGPGKAQTRRRR